MVMAPQNGNQLAQPAFDAEASGRVARMSALQGPSSDSPSYGSPEVTGLSGAVHRQFADTSESEAYGDVAESRHAGAPVVTGKRTGSLSSQSALGALDDHSSPQSGSGGQQSSPEGNLSGQSEQLASFRDYYSPDDIHPNDKVATLWAYQPRATDEFALERGDMLKVVGIWDDGWATGVRVNERAEDYNGKDKIQRDSGVSNGSGPKRESSPLSGEIKAFPVSVQQRRSSVARANVMIAGLCLPPAALEEGDQRRCLHGSRKTTWLEPLTWAISLWPGGARAHPLRLVFFSLSFSFQRFPFGCLIIPACSIPHALRA